MFIFGVILLLMGSLLPSLKVGYAQAGDLGSFPLAGVLIATTLVGPALDIFGIKPVLLVALAMIASALVLMPSLASYPSLATAALAYGLGGGLLNTAANTLVADLSVSGRGAALNLLGFSFSLGAVSAPLLLSSLSGLPNSTVLRGLGATAALVLLPVVAFRFPRPMQSGTKVQDLLRVLKGPAIWLFGVLLFFESGSENCMFVWSSKIVAEVFQTTPQRANYGLLALSCALGVGRLLAAGLLGGLGSRNTLMFSSATVILGASLITAAKTFTAIIAGMAILGLGLASIFPTTLGVVGDRFPRETGTVFGAIMAVALVGGMIGPKVGGWLAAQGPLKVVLIPIFSAVAVAGLAWGATVKKTPV
jgi:fucose permease